MSENSEHKFVIVNLAELKTMFGDMLQDRFQQLKQIAGLAKPTDPDGEFLTTREVMQLFRINARSTLWHWMREGVIPQPVKVPGKRRCMWRRTELDAVLASPRCPIKGQWRH